MGNDCVGINITLDQDGNEMNSDDGLPLPLDEQSYQYKTTFETDTEERNPISDSTEECNVITSNDNAEQSIKDSKDKSIYKWL